MHRLVGDYYLLSREELSEIGVREGILAQLDKYKGVAKSTKDKIKQVSNHFKKTRAEQKNAKLLEVIKLNNTKNSMILLNQNPNLI